MTPTQGTIGSAVAGLLAAIVTWWRPLAPTRRWPLWVAVAAAGAFVVNATLARVRGVPEPRVQDEFSYLLAADTFAHGRLANPTPPAWPALQTFHELVRPTYASKYPPGQGLVLAAGQVTTGMPIVGAWLTAAALAAAAGWAAAGLMPPAWAVGVAVVLAVHPQVIEWSQTYWGGSVAAVGGAMVLGGWARDGVRARAVMGVGLGVLLMSRPYEGIAFAAPLVVDAIWFRRARPVRFSGRETSPPAEADGPRTPSVALPLLLGVVPFVALLCVYNGAVTGRPWRVPYLEYERQYAAAPPLLIGSPRPVPAGVPAAMRAYAEQVELPHFAAQRSVRGFVAEAVNKSRSLWWAALPSPWAWPLVLLVPWAVVADRRLGVVAVAVGTTGLATLASNWTRTQYVAPATAAAVVGVAAAGRRCRPLWAAAVVGTGLLSFTPRPPGPTFQRATLAAQLAHEPGRQLVMVHYAPDSRPDDEWVYNDADPAAAKVVWARADVLPEAAVRAAYPGRTVWQLDVSAAAAAIRRE